jgi:hypothetical protein
VLFTDALPSTDHEPMQPADLSIAISAGALGVSLSALVTSPSTSARRPRRCGRHHARQSPDHHRSSTAMHYAASEAVRREREQCINMRSACCRASSGNCDGRMATGLITAHRAAVRCGQRLDRSTCSVAQISFYGSASSGRRTQSILPRVAFMVFSSIRLSRVAWLPSRGS